MRRREFIAATAATAIGLMPKHPTWAEDNPKQKNKPNILFIMTDQQSASMLSCTGNQWLQTPSLDRLAASGIRFERAYACNPVCVPNRFSLQTGLMPSAIGMRHNGDSATAAVTEAMREQSLGRLFNKAGYETVYGGKVHWPRKMKGVENLGYRNLTTDRRLGLAHACAEFIKGRHTKPFFLFASFINPHDICYMAINDFNRTQGEAPMKNTDSKICEAVLDNARRTGNISTFVEKNGPPLPANHDVPEAEPECIMAKYIEPRPFQAYTRRKWTQDQWRLHRWAYCRLTEMADSKIEIVLDALREAGLEKNTLVVFTSDHGDMDSSHRLEHKQVLYEESVGIPFIMSYKGTIPAGKVDNTHLISNGLDLLPTLCDYAGIDVPEGRSGQSVRPLAEGKPVNNWRECVAVESHYGRMVRTDRYKYCIFDSGKHSEQLTDLKNDPGEMKNLAGLEEYKDVLKSHRRLLRQWVERTGDKIGAEYIKS
jgi:arylsulfatase A-like enzyme